MAILKLNNVEVKYQNAILVLRGVTIEVEIGGIVSLLGNNGAGKSTILRAISGLLKTEEGKVTDGTIEFEGKRIENSDPQKVARSGIIQVMEGRRVLEHLSVEDNLRAGALVARRKIKVKDKLPLIFDYFPILQKLRDKKSGYLSGGEQQMLVLARALMADPKILLLDEPSLGIAPLMVKEIYKLISKINKEEKITILLVEQNAKAALAVSQYGYILENGRIVLDGEASKLLHNEDVKEFYLGLSEVGHKKSYRDVKHYRRRKRWVG